MIWQVFGVVTPPGAIVVPEMMERVACGPDGENRPVGCCFAHWVFPLVEVEPPGIRATKKRLSVRKDAYQSLESFCSEDFSPPHIE
jgi:hypothetical protein